MYHSFNIKAAYLYGGLLGAYLRSCESSDFDLSGHDWEIIRNGLIWLTENNSHFKKYYDKIDEIMNENGWAMSEQSRTLPDAFVLDTDQEPSLPRGRPDIVVNSLDFDVETRNEEYRFHRLPAGVVCQSSGAHRETKETSEVNISVISNILQSNSEYIIEHGNNQLEPLLFPVLYPYGNRHWIYTGPANPRYTFSIRYSITNALIDGR
jgi:hypothetical protein